MADSGSAFRDPHDISDVDENVAFEDNHGDPLTPDDEADNDIEGVTDQTKLHEEFFGDDDEKSNAADEVDRDEIARVKGLKKKQQQKKK